MDQNNFPVILDKFSEYEHEGTKTKIVGLIYSNMIQIILSEANTFGSILHASTDKEGIIYDVEVLLGDRNNEVSRLYPRRLLELFRGKGYVKNSLLLLTSVKKHSIEHLRGVLKHINDHITV